jgi:PEGA domain
VTARRCWMILLALVGATTTALAQPATPTRPQGSGPIVALTPLAALGGEAHAPRARKLEQSLATMLTGTGRTVISPTDVTAKIKAAKQPGLRACDGDDACLAEVGALVGASEVIAGELGGLGDVEVMYLELVDVASRREVRRTQVPIDADAIALRAAVFRLVDPARYLGNLRVDAAIAGAEVHVDGRRLGVTPLAGVALAVGSHALRVTHPDARDYVRFVDINFDQTTSIDAELVRYDSIDTSLNATGGPRPVGPRPTAVRQPAWYRRWWAVTGFGAVVLGGAIIAGTALADDISADGGGTVGPP